MMLWCRFFFFFFFFFQLSEIAILARKHSPWLAWLVWWKCLYDMYVIWFFIFKIFGDLKINKLWLVWLPLKMCHGVWHCVLDRPKKLNVLNILLAKFLEVRFEQYDLWGNWTPQLPTITHCLQKQHKTSINTIHNYKNLVEFTTY